MSHITQGRQTQAPQNSEVCAIVVAYHPDPEFAKRIEVLLPQIGHTVIVDNGSNPEAHAMIKTLAQHPKVSVVWNEVNLGLAKALNLGIKKAIELGHTWVFTLDDDTLVTSDCIEGLLSTLGQYPLLSEVGIMGCNYVNRTTSEFCREPHAQIPWVEVRTLITSGSLMPTRIFEEIGPIREPFFIDCLDFEYCLRARQRGYKILFSLPIGMIHNEGQKTRHKFFFWSLVTHNHGPVRRYYIFRNGLQLIGEYWSKESKWVLGECRNLVREVLAILFFEVNKWPKLKAVMKGICHALIGKMGQLDH